MLYFFDLHRDGHFHLDQEGERADGLEGAQAIALRILSDFGKDIAKEGSPRFISVSVRDVNGKHVLTAECAVKLRLAATEKLPVPQSAA